jgi:hypothetical protein
MIGLNQEELDGILNRVFARRLLPFELREIIRKHVNLAKCLGCDLLYPSKISHGCEIYGHSRCPSCVPSHFCISFDVAPSRPLKWTIPDILESLYEIYLPYRDCRADASNKHYVLTGFNKVAVERIREALEDVEQSKYYGLRGMNIEFVEGVFKESRRV